MTAHIATVEVAGGDWSRSFPVRDAAFGGEVPAGANGDKVQFTYLDAAGEKVATETETVTIESE